MPARRISRRILAKTVAAKLADPTVSRAQVVRSLAAYLVANNMTQQLDMLLNDIAREVAAAKGHLYVSVTSAHDLSESVQRDVAAFLRAHTGASHVELARSVDPDLVGGIRLRTPDQQLDTSVQRKLKRLAHIGEN